MMKLRHTILLGIIAAVPVAAYAQVPANADTTIRATKIEISQIYRPKVKQADKERMDPVLPPRNRELPRFDYPVPQYSPAYAYKPLPLQPLALLKDSVDRGYKHYIRLGAGNRSTFLTDFGSEVYRNAHTDIHVMGSLLSQKGKIAYQQQTYGNLAGSMHFSKDELSAKVDLNLLHRGGYQYGYNHDAFPAKIPAKSSLTGVGLLASISKGTDSRSWSPELTIGLSNYTGAAFDYERSEQVALRARRHFLDKGIRVELGAQLLATEFHSNRYPGIQNNCASLIASATYRRGDFSFRADLRPTIGQNSNSWLLQDLAIDWQADSLTTLSIGTQGQLQRNTYYDLFLRNPFLSAVPTLQSHSNEIYVSGTRTIGGHLSANIRVSYGRHENMATFLNQQGTSSEQMSVLYLPRVSALSLQGGMRYQLAEEVSVGAHIALYNFTKVSFDSKVWHTPNTRIDGDFLWHPMKDLSLSAYMAYVGGNFGLDTNLISKKLKAYADLGVGAEWSLAKNISLFAQVNNLLNSKYERWMGYQAYGMNLFGGIRLKAR